MSRINIYGIIFIIVIGTYYLLILMFNLFSSFTALGTVLATILYVVVESTKQDKDFIEKNSKDLYALPNRNKRSNEFQKIKNRLNNIDKYPNVIFKYFLILYALLFGLVFTLYIGNSINISLFGGLIIAILIILGYVLYLICTNFKGLWDLKRSIREILIKNRN